MKNFSTNFTTMLILCRAVSAFKALFILAMFGLGTTQALAHGDHEAPQKGNASFKPRVFAESDVFSLIGVFERAGLTLYLDRAATNQAVVKASIAFESEELKGMASPQANGTYRIELPTTAQKSTMHFVFTVAAGGESDLLAGDLVLQTQDSLHEHSWWQKFWAWITSWFKRMNTHDDSLTASAGVAQSVADSPQRQSDGAVLIPKSIQRQWALTTQMVQIGQHEKVQEITGKVIADPAGSSRVQAQQAGRFELAGAGFPTLGQVVRQGQILGIIRPSVGVIEQANQQAQATDLASATEMARKRLSRLEQLEGTVAQKDIDAARVEVVSLTERSKGIKASLTAVEALYAPTSGIVSSVSVSLGQVVEARESLFEIVDPKRLRVEAQFAPQAIPSNVKTAKASDGQYSYSLRFLGVGRTLQNGTLPMQFALSSFGAGAGARTGALAIGQAVQVFVGSGERLKGITLPTAAVVKNSKNQHIVWVQHGAERFEPLAVNAQTLNGTEMLVTQGLAANDRVVVQATGLLNQIR